MANPNNQDSARVKRTEQYVQNASFDEEFQVLAFENLVYNAITGTLDRWSGDLKGVNTIQFAKVDTAASGDTQIVAAVTGKKIKLLSCKLISNGTVSIKWRSGTTDLEGANPLVANSGYVLPASSPGQGHYLETAVNTALNINLSGATQVSGHISYYTEA